MFGNDEIRPRYNHSKELNQIKLINIVKNKHVLIKDKSACLIQQDGKWEVSLLWDGIIDNNRWYYPNQPNYKKMVMAKTNKHVLTNIWKKNHDKKLLKSIKCHSLNKPLELRYSKSKNEFYFFDKQKGIIQISHPDLLIEIID